MVGWYCVPVRQVKALEDVQAYVAKLLEAMAYNP
jgi:hypothetical protein